MLRTNDLHYDNSQKGQTLIAVFLVMLVALSIGVTVSTRFIKSSQSIASTDNANKALGVAEAALERILVLPRSIVEDYTANGTCGSDCILTILDHNDQEMTASVELSFMGNSSDDYTFSLDEGYTEEVTLNGYPSSADLEVCWDGAASIYATYVTDTGSDIEQDPYAYAPPTTMYGADGFDDALEMHGYDNCFTVLTRDIPHLLRIRSLHDRADIVIVPAPGADLPVQGILVTSTGVFKGAQREVSVLLTNPKVPSVFDYSIYQNSTDTPLSNSTL